MFKTDRLFAFALILFVQMLAAPHLLAQRDPPRDTLREGPVYHQIEGRVQFRMGRAGNVRVRLLKRADLAPVGETFTRPEGQFNFSMVAEGEYVIETFETEQFEPSSTNVSVRPLQRNRPTTFNVMIELPMKVAPRTPPPGVIAADVDLDVPKPAQKHYRAGQKALEEQDSASAVKEFRAAIEIYPKYYAARLELGRELRAQKKFDEALTVLQPLAEVAPRRAEPRIEQGIALMALNRRDEAAQLFEAALKLEEPNWAAHLFLGWALLEKDEGKAGVHFTRALELDEQKAARAHLALARIANSKGQRQLAIQHLDAYLAISPDAHDAEAARRLAEQLRSSN